MKGDAAAMKLLKNGKSVLDLSLRELGRLKTRARA
jgi:hypothetical protein